MENYQAWAEEVLEKVKEKKCDWTYIGFAG